MPKITVIPPTADLLESVLSLIGSEKADLRGHLVIFPGRRPAHYLRKALGRRFDAAFIAPRILSYDDFGEFLSRDKLGDTARNLEPIDAAALLFEAHQAIDERFGGKQFLSLDRFLPVALKLFDELEELHLANLSSTEVHSVIGALTYASMHSIPHYYSRFYDAVRARGFSTRASRLRRVAEDIKKVDLSEFDQIILAGFYALTAVDQVIFRWLAERDQTVMLFQEGKGLAKHLAKIGVRSESESGPERREAPRIRMCKASDTHGQVFALSHALGELSKAGEVLDERTVIVLPSAGALLPVLHHVLPTYEPEQYNISLRYPVARTPAYGFLSRLLSVTASVQNGQIALSEYMEFVLHPYAKSIRYQNRTDATRVLMHSIEDHLRRRRSGALMTLEQIEQNTAIFQTTARRLSAESVEASAASLAEHLKSIHDNTIRRFWRIDTVGDFARRCIDVLLFVHEHSTADAHPLFRPYVEHLIELLRTCATSLLADLSFGDASSYQRFLRDVAGRSEVPFPGTPLRGIQVLGLLETRNISFERVYVLDASDDVLPGTSSETLFIPQQLREKLGLQTVDDRETMIEYYVDLLRSGAREVTYFFCEDGKKEKSRFLQKLIWAWEQRDGRPDDGRFVESVRYAVRLTNPTPLAIGKDAALASRLKKLAYSASSLDRYLACPLQFYYADVLGLEERRALANDPDQRDVGSIVHQVLRALYEGTIERRLSPNDLTDDRLEMAVGRVFLDQFGPTIPGKAMLIQRQIRLQLRQFLAHHEIPRAKAEEITIVGLEVPVQATRDGFVFKGRIDRVERRSGKVVILDYKTGRDDKRFAIRTEKLDLENPATWPEAVGSVQLPMYWMLYGAVSGESLDRISPAYVLLGKKDFRERVEVGMTPEGNSPTELYSLLDSFLLRLVSHICDPGIPFSPAADLRTACPGCPYQPLCGTQWLSDRAGS